MKKILVVDDEKKIVEIITAYLQREGYLTVSAYDGEQAIEIARAENPDLIILDLMIPKISGWDVCRTIRKESEVPIIMVTARDETTDKIIGLELGADDYVTKPFDTKELVSRVRAVLRRTENKSQKENIIKVGEIDINIDKREVKRNGELLELTPSEFQLLTVLSENPGHVLSRMQLLDKVQGDSYEGYERTIDSHIKNLRKKVEPDPDNPKYILTVRGIGYKLGEG